MVSHNREPKTQSRTIPRSLLQSAWDHVKCWTLHFHDVIFDILGDKIKMDMTEVYEERHLSSDGNIKTSPNQQPKRAKEWRRERDSDSNAFPKAITGETRGQNGGKGGRGEGGVAIEWDENHEHYKKKRKKGGYGQTGWRERENEWQMSLISFHCLNLLFEKTPHVWPEKREKQNENRHQQSTCCTISKKCKLMTGSKNLQRKQHPSLSIAINKSSTAYGNVNFNMKR